MKQLGKFITLEGGDAVGKTTLIISVQKYLEQQGIKTVLTHEPGGTEVAENLRALLLSPSQETLASETELLLMVASRIQHVKEVIIPSVEQGYWVLCDRYIDSTFAYQGYGRGMDLNVIEQMHQIYPFPVPDLTFLLSLEDEQIRSQRVNKRRGHEEQELMQHLELPVQANSQQLTLAQISLEGSTPTLLSGDDRFEKETMSFKQKVHEGFVEQAKKAQNRILMLDASDTPESLLEQAKRRLQSFLECS